MNHTRGLVSIALALRQTFVVPSNTTRTASCRLHPIQNTVQTRSFQQCHRLAGSDASKMHFKDEAIRGPFVQVVNEEGSLNSPVKLSHLLNTIDRTEFFVQQVSPATHDRPAVCKILNKQEVRENEKARAKVQRAAKVTMKQLEINWAIDAHDLAHRLKQLTNFLGKGRKVEVVLTKKKGKRAPTVEEVKHVMQSIRDTAQEASAVQVQAMEGEPGKQVKITLKKETSSG